MRQGHGLWSRSSAPRQHSAQHQYNEDAAKWQCTLTPALYVDIIARIYSATHTGTLCRAHMAQRRALTDGTLDWVFKRHSASKKL